jgi:hypothetical protein
MRLRPNTKASFYATCTLVLKPHSFEHQRTSRSIGYLITDRTFCILSGEKGNLFSHPLTSRKVHAAAAEDCILDVVSVRTVTCIVVNHHSMYINKCGGPKETKRKFSFTSIRAFPQEQVQQVASMAHPCWESGPRTTAFFVPSEKKEGERGKGG